MKHPRKYSASDRCKHLCDERHTSHHGRHATHDVRNTFCHERDSVNARNRWGHDR